MRRKNGTLRGRCINPTYALIFNMTTLLRIPDDPTQHGMFANEPIVCTQFDDLALPMTLTHGWRQFPARHFEVLNP